MNHTLDAGFRQVFERSGCVLLLVDPQRGRIVDANSVAVSFYGYPLNKLSSMTLSQLNVLDEEEIALLRKQSLFPERRLFTFRHRLASGEERDVEISFSPVDGGGTPLLFSIVHDITAVKQAQEDLRNSEAIYRATFQTTSDAVSISRSHDGMFIDLSQAFLKMTGYNREEVIGRTSVELNIWSGANERERFLGALRTGSLFSGLEFEFRKKSGEIFLGRVSVSKIEIDRIAYLLIVTTDISAAKEAEDKIRNLAFFDPLTRLPNRSLLLDRIEQAQLASLRNGSGLALLLVDLDNFKTLNDTLGRNAGDAVLQEVSSRLKQCTHETDTVARLGADEFAVMIVGLSDNDEDTATKAKQVADNISAAIRRPLLFESRECVTTSCIGIKVFQDHQKDAVGLLDQAEIALHQARAQGRGSIQFFSSTMHAAANARISLEEDLRAAIEREQFLLLYQPQVDADGLAGAEVLIRWNHPTRGLVSPLDFIPLAEETGLILQLGNWVLEAACKQIVEWEQREELLRISLAVNISARQFGQPEFVEQVLAALRRTGANPSKLKLELTETIMVDNLEDTIAKMKLLKSHGLSFSMDDFGTGYSSLAYLKRLPLDQLKIDRAFVREILLDVASGAIAQTIISLGLVMGLSVIAEGVETVEQRDFLIGLGCHSFQGYLFSRPLPLEEFEAWFEEYTKSPTRTPC